MLLQFRIAESDHRLNNNKAGQEKETKVRSNTVALVPSPVLLESKRKTELGKEICGQIA